MHWKRFSHLECGSSKRQAHTSLSLSTTSGVLLTGPPPLKMHERHFEWAADPLRRFSYKAVACAQRSLRSKLSEKLGAVMKCRTRASSRIGGFPRELRAFLRDQDLE